MTHDPSPATKTALNWTAILAGGAVLVGAVVVFFFLFAHRWDPGVDGVFDENPGVESPAARQASLDAGWAGPPADADQTALIPQAFGGWDVTAADENAANPAFGLDRDGFHGAYSRVKTPVTVDLYVYRADGDEAAAFDTLRDRLGDRDRFGEVRFNEPDLPGAARTSQFDIAKAEGVPQMHGLLARADGWLLFAKSETERGLAPFLAAYMKVVEADGTAEPPADIPADLTPPETD